MTTSEAEPDQKFEVIGVFSVDTDWVQAYDDGDFSEEEYLDRVHETIE